MFLVLLTSEATSEGRTFLKCIDCYRQTKRVQKYPHDNDKGDDLGVHRR